MWLFQPLRMCILAGLCMFGLVFLVKEVESGVMGARPRQKGFPYSSLRNLGRRPPKTSLQRKPQKTPKKSVNSPFSPKTSMNQCPGNSESIQMNCLSCKAKPYRTCPVAAATTINQVQIITEYDDSYNTCDRGRKKNYGISGNNAIWVNDGCRAKFLICYEKGRHEPKNINCMCTTSKRKCPVNLPGVNIHIQVNMLWSFGSGKCKENQSWGYDDQDIWVDKGCSATFRVVW